MSTVIKKQQLIDWYNSINAIRSKENINLSAISVPDSSRTVLKATDFNALVSAINALKSNTYLSYADWTLVPSPVSRDNIIKEQSFSVTDDMLESLVAVCANYVVNATTAGQVSFSTSSYGVEAVSFSTTANVNDGNASNSTLSNSTYSTDSTTNWNPDNCNTRSDSTTTNSYNGRCTTNSTSTDTTFSTRTDSTCTTGTNSTNTVFSDTARFFKGQATAIFSTSDRTNSTFSTNGNSTSRASFSTNTVGGQVNSTFTNSTFSERQGNSTCSTNSTKTNTTSNHTNAISTFYTRATAFSVRG